MGLNPNAPAWTPGLCSSGERSGDSPDRNGRTAHCVGMHHKCEEGVESDGVGRLNLPVNQDTHRADKFSQRVRTAIKQKQKNGAGKRGRGAGLSVGVLGKQHIPPSGGKNVKTFRWDHRLQIQNLFMAFNGAPFSYRNRTPHLYDFFLLRFVIWLLRAYKYRQLRP